MIVRASGIDPDGSDNARPETFYAEVTVVSEPYDKVITAGFTNTI